MTSRTDGSRPSGSRSPSAKMALCSWSTRLARTMRCAIVADGTWKPRAISAVVSPPTIRSVSATCASREISGWQHSMIRRSLSSGIESRHGRRDAAAAAVSLLASSAATDSCARALVLSRSTLRARLRHTVISQAPGLSGIPVSGHRSRAATSVSAATSSAACRSAVIRSAAPIRLGHSSRNSDASAASVCSVTARSPHPGLAARHVAERQHRDPAPAEVLPALRQPLAAAAADLHNEAEHWPARASVIGHRDGAHQPPATQSLMPGRQRGRVSGRQGGGPLGPPGTGCPPAGTRSSHRHDLADLDRAKLRVRAPLGDRHGSGDVGRLDQEVSGDDLLALGERPVRRAGPVTGPDLLRLLMGAAASRRSARHPPAGPSRTRRRAGQRACDRHRSR